MVARLQGHVERRAGCRFAARFRIRERSNLGVSFAGALVPTLADHASIADEDAAYARIRGRREQAVRGKIERAPHALAIAVIERHVSGGAESAQRDLRRGDTGSTSFNASRKSAAS